MTATNHALTGAAIGLLVANPAIALPAAFLSHFVLDAIPHYDADDNIKRMKSAAFKKYLLAEALICFLIVLGLAFLRPVHWYIAALCAFLAASPDLYSIRRYRATLQGHKYKEDWFAKFADRIQWFERPVGAVVEVAWFAAVIALLIPVIKTLAKS